MPICAPLCKSVHIRPPAMHQNGTRVTDLEHAKLLTDRHLYDVYYLDRCTRLHRSAQDCTFCATLGNAMQTWDGRGHEGPGRSLSLPE